VGTTTNLDLLLSECIFFYKYVSTIFWYLGSIRIHSVVVVVVVVVAG
jgi:hypothetical protein